MSDDEAAIFTSSLYPAVCAFNTGQNTSLKLVWSSFVSVSPVLKAFSSNRSVKYASKLKAFEGVLPMPVKSL